MDSTVAQKLRLRIDLAYDGTEFHGWACQPGLRTVEGELTAALEKVLREKVILTVAGRTDAGVHARGQVVHVDVTPTALETAQGRAASWQEALLSRLTGILRRSSHSPGSGSGSGRVKGGSDLLIRAVSEAPDGFDARFSALGRAYTYRICDERAAWDPLRTRDVLWLDRPLDLEAMNRSAVALLGEHDFLSFCKPREGATTIRTLQRLEAVRRGGIIEIYAQADAFCHSMVRTLVGTLMKVGEGTRSETWPKERLKARTRDGNVIVAPAHPLTLEKVFYPHDEELGQRARQARARRSCAC